MGNKVLWSLLFGVLLMSSNVVLAQQKADSTKDIKVNSVVISRQVVYDVVIKNPDKSDEWAEQCLKDINRNRLAQIVFGAIYSGKANAYKYDESDRLMTIQEVRNFENAPNHKREQIAKVQFIEEWQFDEYNFTFSKKVNGIMLAYEFYDEDGSIRGYKAGIKVMFKKNNKPQNGTAQVIK